MLTRNWYSDGWDAYNAGQPKMSRFATGAGDFNEGWSDAEQWSEERAAHLQANDERSEIVDRICDQDGELDVEALAEVLHDLGVRI